MTGPEPFSRERLESALLGEDAAPGGGSDLTPACFREPSQRRPDGFAVARDQNFAIGLEESLDAGPGIGEDARGGSRGPSSAFGHGAR